MFGNEILKTDKYCKYYKNNIMNVTKTLQGCYKQTNS